MTDSRMTPGGDRQRRFHMRDCLGRGGFGEVYLATMVSPGGLKSEVAVKLLRDASPDALRRLRDEGKLLAALNHPAILRALDLAGLDGNVALVMEYVDGADLNDLTNASGVPMSPRAVLEVIAVVAEALEVAYSTIPPDADAPLRLVHRDVKPSNIRIGRHGEVKLLDFGIAWAAVTGREAQTNATAMMGSLPYMAPERFARTPAHTASDVYALGCTMYESLYGERLFPDVTPVEMVRLASSKDGHDGHVQAALALLPPDARLAGELIADMLAYEPVERPSAEQVAERCDTLAQQAAGARLKVWARRFDWASARSGGPLSGQTLTEQTLSMMSGMSGVLRDSVHTVDRTIDLGASGSWGATFDVSQVAPDAAVAQSAEPTSRRPIVLGVFGVLLLGVAAMGWQFTRPNPPQELVTPEVVALPAPVEPVQPEPETVPEVVAEPEPVPEPDVAVVVPRRVRPRSVAPTPKPVPKPAEPVPVPEPSRVGLISGPTDVLIVLKNARGTEFSTGEVPAGLYDIWADFGHGPAAVGKVDVVADGVVRIHCNSIRYTCEPKY